jgi:hypothetical protein
MTPADHICSASGGVGSPTMMSLPVMRNAKGQDVTQRQEIEMDRSHEDPQCRRRLRRRGAGVVDGTCLTPEQRADRNAVMADPIYPVPPPEARLQRPRFMGWTRYEWARAPEPLVEHFGMRQAWASWRREIDEACLRLGMPPEFDRNELYRRWQEEHEVRVEEYESSRIEEPRRPERRRRRRAAI